METINFNSRDWRSIQDTIDKIKEFGELQVGRTDDGETIIFDVRDENALVTEVIQHNGWVRRNIYHTDDLTVEEIYEKA